MSEDNERTSPEADAEERRRRASELHEQIEQLERDSAPDEGDPPRKPSPREFTEKSVRKENEREQENDEQC